MTDQNDTNTLLAVPRTMTRRVTTFAETKTNLFERNFTFSLPLSRFVHSEKVLITKHLPKWRFRPPTKCRGPDWNHKLIELIIDQNTMAHCAISFLYSPTPLLKTRAESPSVLVTSKRYEGERKWVNVRAVWRFSGSRSQRSVVNFTSQTRIA